MNGVGKVFEDVPDPISEVEVERVEVMNLRRWRVYDGVLESW